MLKGVLALVMRQALLVAGGGLAAAGIITQTSVTHFCFDARAVADVGAGAILAMTGGGASIALSAGWRIWAKGRGGRT